MELGGRLRAIAAQVGSFQRMADIGTDHAFLPVWLIQNNRITYAVAGDVQPGPLEAAKRSVREAGLEPAIAVRLGNGLQVVAPGEVDVVVIAGMGGPTIREILESSPTVVSKLSRIVCQPMIGAAILREWFLTNGWKIIDEDLVMEDGRLYEIIVAEPGKTMPIAELLLEIGPVLWRRQHPLLREHLIRLRQQYARQAGAMEKSSSMAVEKRRQVVMRKIGELEEKLACLQPVE
jgi:tRNA (adenine22-N1)-methyltransferase